MSDNKYYWLKLKNNFFKRHDIRIIEDMDNGKDYVLFYLKLLVESIDHEGCLRFSDTIPYDEKMLATITNTNVDIVRSAMKVFSQLKLIEMIDNDTIFMTEIDKMIGCQSKSAERVQRFRRRAKIETIEVPAHVAGPKESSEKYTKKFEEIWKRYPNNDGKKQAYKYFTVTVKTEADWKNINKALDNYLISARVKKGYIKNGSTWFNNWSDWIELPEAEKWCEKCKNTGITTSTTGYTVPCSCHIGKSKK